ncbi:beclin-1 [Anaeramoeba flamelloides]|uniref:Beclin-1 n=1 Tax=Anaeramoeba flamelloides TaxID=1746091 RepID=A0AAV7ZT72_9EUKA|nr:beclin-1 [Anaeramoeba flamelloides]
MISFVCQKCQQVIEIHESLFFFNKKNMKCLVELLELDTQQLKEIEDLCFQLGKNVFQRRNEKIQKEWVVVQNEGNKNLLSEKDPKNIKKKDNEIINEQITKEKERGNDKENDKKRQEEKKKRFTDLEKDFEEYFLELLEQREVTQNFVIDENKNQKQQELKTSLCKKLFNLISTQTKEDFPLCSDCTILWSKAINEKIKDKLRQKKVYHYFVDHFQTTSMVDDQALAQNIQQYDVEIDQILKEIEELTSCEEEIDQELIGIQERETTLAQLEKKYYQDFNNLQRLESSFQLSRKSLITKIKTAQSELDKLLSTSVFNGVFRIYFNDHFATINNLRIGKLDSVPVEIEEINAAFGLVTMLSFVLSKRVGFKSKKYILLPLGSFSKIHEIKKVNNKNNNKRDLTNIKDYKELYLTQDGFMKRIGSKKFNKAIVSFLDYIKELGAFVNKYNENFKMKYQIEIDQINGFLIKYSSNSLVEWTRALKYLLIDLKQLMYWCSCFRIQTIDSFHHF